MEKERGEIFNMEPDTSAVAVFFDGAALFKNTLKTSSCSWMGFKTSFS